MSPDQRAPQGSVYRIPVVGVVASRLARAWLMLGVGALAIAGLFAILLVLARSPGAAGFLPWLDFFHTALVVHVDQSVLIWFLAFAGVVWSLTEGRFQGLRWLAFSLAASGTLVIALSPFAGAGDPLMNNYVPVLQHPLFFTGLGLFGLGISIQALLAVASLPSLRLVAPGSVARLGGWTAALATLFALMSLGWSFGHLDDRLLGQARYEALFWGPGHTLQFAYTQLMLVAWLWLAQATAVRLPVARGVIGALLLLGVAPLLLVPAIHLSYEVISGESRLAFTRLMQWGGGLAAIPIGLAVFLGLLRAPPADDRQRPVRRALGASLLLFVCGGLIGWLISGVNTVIPAHYHGSIVGVTLALMGLSYQLLPVLGYAAPVGRMASAQPVIYAVGQLLHVLGLAVSGAMGIQRKTAGAAQGLDDLPAMVAMGVMGLGGLLAVVGGILFVVVVLKAMWRRSGKD